jgi:hypothetical protein
MMIAGLGNCCESSECSHAPRPQKAERRAKFALGYLVILCVMLILIAGVLISVGQDSQKALRRLHSPNVVPASA